MFKKGTQQPEEMRRRRSVSVEQSKIFSYQAIRAAEIDTRQRLRPEATEVQARAQGRSQWLSVRYIPTMIAGFIVIGCVIYNTFLASSPRVIISGDASARVLLQDVSTYQTVIQQELEQSVLNRSKLTFDVSGVTEALTKRFPEVSSLRVSLPLIGQKPIIYIVPTEPAAIVDSQNGSFVLDAQGRVISDDATASPLVSIRIRDDSGLTLAAGEQAVSKDNLRFITEVTRQLADKGVTVTEVILPAGSQSVLFGIEGASYKVKFSFQGDAVQQAGAFLATYDRLNQTATKPSQYVDVRVVDRVYFQ